MPQGAQSSKPTWALVCIDALFLLQIHILPSLILLFIHSLYNVELCRWRAIKVSLMFSHQDEWQGDPQIIFHIIAYEAQLIVERKILVLYYNADVLRLWSPLLMMHWTEVSCQQPKATQANGSGDRHPLGWTKIPQGAHGTTFLKRNSVPVFNSHLHFLK